MVLDLKSSRILPLTPEQAFDHTIATDLTKMFDQGSGPIPAIKSTVNERGAWSGAGDRRRIHLADGNSTLETMVAHNRPGTYGYELSEITGPLKLLVAKVEGQFSFVASGAGTEVTWSWRLHPKNPVVAPLLRVVGHFWKGYAARGLANLEALVAA